ncbi:MULTISPECIES: hypothetical protein [Yersinia]|uniref:Uncharacterized protein n=1 Tax=Yersinia kristensenii TaxID=28152 RepID=A0AB73P1M3_YERKR|nr:MULTISPECIES: hypothetical protein [Yersinia]EMC5231566.1 hypothetical protein [Yersinia enterocolitica]MCW6568271.1 hypothetical protein [Yersinia ruckeri]OVZ78607.1 hypothetical protein CBW52_18375 [Yersinia kristensenii]
MRLLTENMFQRLTTQRLVSISEVVNSLYGINPNTKTKDLPDDISEEAQDIKKAIARNLKSLGNSYVTISSEVDADLVFGAAHQFLVEGITPREIIDRAIEAVSAYVYTNDWENIMFAFGGRLLVDDMTKIRKTGRGKHKKEDEENGTLKMVGLLIKLLAKNHASKKYGTSEAPTITEIYRSIIALAEEESITLKGIGKSTFASKSAAAIRATTEF